jgi:hypothetical protein
MPLRNPAVLPDAVCERSWDMLWRQLLQPIPDDTDPASDPDEHPDDEVAAEDSTAT